MTTAQLATDEEEQTAETMEFCKQVYDEVRSCFSLYLLIYKKGTDSVSEDFWTALNIFHILHFLMLFRNFLFSKQRSM